jgi:hypothetical protein
MSDGKVSSIVAFRMPANLEQEITAIAQRDHNTVSSTLRRLLASALRVERRAVDSDRA